MRDAYREKVVRERNSGHINHVASWARECPELAKAMRKKGSKGGGRVRKGGLGRRSGAERRAGT